MFQTCIPCKLVMYTLYTEMSLISLCGVVVRALAFPKRRVVDSILSEGGSFFMTRSQTLCPHNPNGYLVSPAVERKGSLGVMLAAFTVPVFFMAKVIISYIDSKLCQG